MTDKVNAAIRVLFVHNGLSRFVRSDLESLRAAFRVEECFLPTPRCNPFRVWGQVGRSDVVFGWFASWHTFLPVLAARTLGKPSLIVAGGYDVADLPESGYGHQRGGLKRIISRWILGTADCVLPFSQFSAGEIERNADIRLKEQHVVYLGAQDRFGMAPEKPREPLVLTVGNVDKANLFRKGLEPYVRAAALLPQVRFLLVGQWKDKAIERLREIATPNVHFSGWLSEDALLDHYRSSWVYVQASLHEGFGLSVAEAMLAGCIPVVTASGALPEIAGEAGVYVNSNRSEDVAATISEVLRWSHERRAAVGRLGRQRILRSYPVGRRSDSLNLLVVRSLQRR